MSASRDQRRGAALRAWAAGLAGLAGVLAAVAPVAPAREKAGSSPIAHGGVRLELGAGPDLSAFERVTLPRPFVLPDDHGPHFAFQTEWWYFTGQLSAADGRRFGFQLTFFRRGLSPGPPPEGPGLATNQVYFAHFAVTDVGGGRQAAAERFSRGAPILAGATGRPFAVWLEDWRVEAPGEAETVAEGARDSLVILRSSGGPGDEGSAGGRRRRILRAADSNDGPQDDSAPRRAEQAGQRRPEPAWRLHARDAARGLELELDLLARKPLVAHGDRGVSPKSDEPGNASYYVGYTRMSAQGRVRAGTAEADVSGEAWFDHEWSTSALGAGAVGWDWFSLQLDDGRELMLFRIRREDGSIEAASSGTLVEADGRTRSLAREEFSVDALATWTSPHSGGRYPSAWRIVIPSEDLELHVAPLVADQEMRTSFVYWEGACSVRGTARDRPASGNGYVELTGYARSMQGVF